MVNKELTLVLRGDRNGPFRRTVDNIQLTFRKGYPVYVTKGQFEGLKKDLGTALLFAKETDKGVTYDWLRTKMQCLADAEQLVEETGSRKGLSIYQAVCLDSKDEILKEFETQDQASEPDLDELAEGIGLPVDAVRILIEHPDFPKSEGKFPLTEIMEWLKSKDGKSVLQKTMEEIGANEPAKNSDDEIADPAETDPEIADPETPSGESEPVLLKNQKELAAFFEVDEKTVKSWAKAGLKKNGNTYDPEEVAKFLDENGLLDDLPAKAGAE